MRATPDHQLAVRMILHQYLVLGSYLFETIVEEVDENGDTKVTLEEMVGFRNFQFAEDLEKVALGLGQPGGTVSYLVSGGLCWWEERKEILAMQLTALQVVAGEVRHIFSMYVCIQP